MSGVSFLTAIKPQTHRPTDSSSVLLPTQINFIRADDNLSEKAFQNVTRTKLRCVEATLRHQEGESLPVAATYESDNINVCT